MTHIACHINALQLPFGACTVPLTFTLPAAGCTLIGRNGIGKSLLLELLAGQRRAASGKIEWLTPISWLSQFAPAQAHDDAASVADMIGWSEPLRALERIEQGSCALDDFERLADRWNLRSDLADLLAEAGLRLDAHTPVSTLSGGQLTRLRLLALFARSAHFLLLDEPDNHLDASGIAWLSQRLASHSGGYLLVSHDRRLLNQTSQILELGEQGLQSASLSFEAFLAQQAELQAARSARLAQAERREKAARAACKGCANRRPDGPARGGASAAPRPRSCSISKQSRRVNPLARYWIATSGATVPSWRLAPRRQPHWRRCSRLSCSGRQRAIARGGPAAGDHGGAPQALARSAGRSGAATGRALFAGRSQRQRQVEPAANAAR